MVFLVKHQNLNENFILLDSDVLLKKPIDFIDENFICVSDTIKIKPELSRISPMLAYMNVEKIKKYNIDFFDGKRMHGLCKITEKYLYYDTGTSFLEDIEKIKLFKKINTEDYFVHYGNGSWRLDNNAKCPAEKNKQYENITYYEWLKKYKELWR